MAKKPRDRDAGSWLLLEDLLERGDPAFVDELRKLTDADRLGAFAPKWYADKRAASRRLLLEYLGRPLNAFRHEALVKRLFKLAEQAADDEVMGRFLVLLDRSVRRKRRTRHHYDYQARTSWQEEHLKVPPHTTMPRPRTVTPALQAEPQRKYFERFRLFSVHTRNYLRRRAWRYFRRLGKQHPDRYVPAVAAALKLYEDADVADGVALLDNWGLVHVLFHHCPALVARPNGWLPAEGHTLAELAPAPMYEKLWQAAPRALLDLIKSARCRPVRQWMVRLIRRDHGSLLTGLPLAELLTLLAHDDPEVVALAAEALRGAAGLDSLSLESWLGLLETPNPAALEILCELMTAHLRPDRLTLEQAVWLARKRPLPIARLGFTLLRTKTPASAADHRALLGLAEAEAEPLRAELVRWARGVLSASASFQPEWVLEYLDSRHAEVRAEGWRWFREEPRARDNVELWRRLLESPYDDVRLLLVADLEDRVARHEGALTDQARLDPELVRFLWGSVLLNIYRGGKVKPLVVGQLVRRVERRPEEAAVLLPILSVALRSVRGPEWRAGLAGVVRLVERNAGLMEPVRRAFPELKMV
jgi:hypothetical protein